MSLNLKHKQKNTSIWWIFRSGEQMFTRIIILNFISLKKRDIIDIIKIPYLTRKCPIITHLIVRKIR